MVLRNYNASTQSRSGTLTEIAEDIELESQGFRSISKQVIPYVRSKTISISAKSMKPFTKLFVYFDKQNVSGFVTPDATGAVGTTFGSFSDVETPVVGSTMISDGVGNFEASFTIPDPKVAGNLRFKTGDVEVVVTADPNNKQVGDGANELVARETFAEAIYSAKGTLDTQQETIISTRNATLITTRLNETSGLILGQQVNNNNYGGDMGEDGGAAEASESSSMDPLAQTFIVIDTANEDTSKLGSFATSCDVYFFEKDDTYPVTMEIRNVLNGNPGPKVLPFGRKTLQSGEIRTSTDGSIATTFTFDSPVYMQGGSQYSICLLANTPDHKVWISDLGTQDTSGNEITDQPHVGVLFKSSNNNTWVPSPTQDMKFTLRRASFDTSAAGLVTLQNKTLPVKTLKVNPLEMTDASTTLKINHVGHAMHTTGNNVTIDEVKSGVSTTLNGALNATATSITLTSGTNFDDTSGKYSRDASNVYYIKIDDEIISYTTISGTGITSATRGANSTTATTHANGATVELYQIHKVPLTDINKTHTAIGNIQSNSYTITLATTPVVDGAGSVSSLGGEVVTATENAQYDLSTFNMGTLTPPSTKIDTAILATSGTSQSGTEQSFVKSTKNRVVPLGENYYYPTTNIVASEINETNEMAGVKSLTVPMTLTSDIDALSPVIDLQRTSMVAVANQIDVIDSSSDVFPTSIYRAMTEPEGDNHAAIYITKKINLENPATSIRLLMDVNREPSADVKVLFKTLRVDDAFDFDEISYKFFNDDGTIAGSGEPDVETRFTRFDEYVEHQYTAGVTDDGIGNPLDEFISFQIKIVMRATNQARPPRIKKLRAIALAT